MSASQKVNAIFAWSQLLFELARAEIRRLHPDAGEHEVFFRAAARRLDRDTMLRVYGFDPERADMTDSASALRRVLDAFDRLGVPHLACGSVASGAHGLYRATADVDLVADIRAAQVADLACELGNDFYADQDLIREALRTGRSFNLIHYSTASKFDVFPLSPDPYQQSQFARRRIEEVDYGGGEKINYR